MTNDGADTVRLDRWLWAARFFKTRSAAKSAIDGGKVHCAGQRTKPSKEVSIGMELTIVRGRIEQIVVITGVSSHRGGSAQAEALYRESPQSIERRLAEAAERRQFGPRSTAPLNRPSRRDRRELVRLKQSSTDEST